MKNATQGRKATRSFFVGAAVALAACTFSACDREAEEAVSPLNAIAAETQNGAIIPGKYIVVMNEGTLRLDAAITYKQRVQTVRDLGQQLLKANGVKEVNIDQAYGKALVGMAVTLSKSEAEQLRKDPRVAYVEPDRMLVLGKPDRTGGDNSGQQATPWGITRVGTGNGTGKTAWVIDTGVDLDHPDLKVDAARSETFVQRGKDAQNADDGNGHGTHVAGTIAAINNSTGVIGVAAGATIVAVKVLNAQGSGSYSDVMAGVDYVAANGKAGDVANMSLGGPVSKALDDIVKNASANVKFALAAGNESSDAINSSPARVSGPNIYTVSAMDNTDTFAYFSNYGNPPIDYCAPGVSILSTWKSGGYNTISGTSMAAPHVAGLLLLGISSSGTVKGDKDNTPDPIAVLKK
ncbi:S8 family peptidase [Pontibacter sp. CAU 1760]